MHAVHFSSQTVEWATPRELFKALNAVFCFTLDPCATPENATCDRFFTAHDDGLRQSWAGERVYMNPPYGREIAQWGSQSCRVKGTCRYAYAGAD